MIESGRFYAQKIEKDAVIPRKNGTGYCLKTAVNMIMNPIEVNDCFYRNNRGKRESKQRLAKRKIGYNPPNQAMIFACHELL